MVRFYMDENVSRAITNGLRQRGVDVLTVQEEGLAGIPDPAVLDRATELNRVLFTHDMDFLVEVSLRQGTDLSFVGVIYAHPERVSIRKCIEDLEFIATAGESEEFAGRVEYLPL